MTTARLGLEANSGGYLETSESSALQPFVGLGVAYDARVWREHELGALLNAKVGLIELEIASHLFFQYLWRPIAYGQWRGLELSAGIGGALEWRGSDGHVDAGPAYHVSVGLRPLWAEEACFWCEGNDGFTDWVFGVGLLLRYESAYLAREERLTHTVQAVLKLEWQHMTEW